MNKETAKDYLPLVQALAEGKVIQIMVSGKWEDCHEVNFPFPAEEYRVKAEPREVWVNEYVGEAGFYCYTSLALAKSSVAEGGTTRRYREVIE